MQGMARAWALEGQNTNSSNHYWALIMANKQLYGILMFHREIVSERRISKMVVKIGKKQSCDFVVDAFELPEFTIFKDGKLHLLSDMTATLQSRSTRYMAGDKRSCFDTLDLNGTPVERWDFGEDDWAIVNLAPNLDLVLCYRNDDAPVFFTPPIVTIAQYLESPLVRALVVSFAIHTAVIFIASLAQDPVEAFILKQRESRWVEVVSTLDERAEEDKPEEEEIPVLEDTDNVIIDDAMKDENRPKIDDSKTPIANLQNVEKPVGLQAAIGGAKLHDMESLFGSSAGLGNASDFMPETADGDAFGTGAGFGAGLSGVGFGGGGGGGGGYGSGIGGFGGGGAKGSSKAAVAGPKKSAVKQKTKLNLEPPKQGAFCKESNIREVVQKRANALRNCYEQQLLANPDLSGKIIVFWKIGLDGKVTDASIKSSTMNNNRVESCLTQTVRRMRFDKPDGGICVVEYPFIFTSAQ